MDMKRSAATAIERMKAAKIPCWIEAHRRMKWRLAMRIALLPDERWATKAAEWNPGFSTKHQTNRAEGRPKKIWEDVINDLLKPKETEDTKGNEIKKQRNLDRERWKANTQRQQPKHVLTSVHSRRYPLQDPVRPARYLNGVIRGGDHRAATHQGPVCH